MEIFGHVITFYSALKQEFSHERAVELVEEHAAKLCLTDAIRFTIKDCDDVVKYGRGYSHFTDGCYMKLPFGDELKAFTNISQTSYHTGEGYVSKFADEPTDFAKFISLNPDMFKEPNESWGVFVLSHLCQDVDTDDFWQRELCSTYTKDNFVHYNITNKVVDGQKFRKDMALANIYIHNIFVTILNSLYDVNVFEIKEVIEAAKTSFRRWYETAMAENTCKYLDMDIRVFATTSEELGELVQEIIDTGLFETEEQMLDMSISLLDRAIISLNSVMNWIRLNEK